MRIAMAVTAMVLGTAAVTQAAPTAADYKFGYSYPAQAARIAPLRAWLKADRARLRADIARQAKEGRAEARKGGYTFNPYEAQTIWKVVTDTPRLLSLSGDVYSYTGGAHGSPGSAAILWDKAARRRIAPQTVFVSPAMLQRVIAPAYCARLKAERTARVGPVNEKDGPFGTCPGLKDLTLLLGSSDGKRVNRIGLIADPYVAGSYAEGAYEVTLPVTPAILATVKPAYRAAFAGG